MTPSAEPPINWEPLERFCELATARGVTGLDADDFMWMGRGHSPAGVPVQLYRHVDSRCYLNLDASGHTYVWRSGDDSYVLTSLLEAIDRLSESGSSVAAGIAAEWSAHPGLVHARFVEAPTDCGHACGQAPTSSGVGLRDDCRSRGTRTRRQAGLEGGPVVEYERDGTAPGSPAPAEPTRSMPVQRRLAVGAASDPLEREADRVADDVLGMIATGGPSSAALFGGTETRIRRSAGVAPRRAAPAALSPEVGPGGGYVGDEIAATIRRAHGSGARLDRSTRSAMESAFGVSFADVRIHRDSLLPTRISAAAFTAGSDIHVAPGLYRPSQRDGQHLLAHELAHVVQQGGGGAGVQRTPLQGNADASSLTRTEPKIQRRNTKFVPFKPAGRAKHNVDVTALVLDDLNEHGLHYATGGTVGNDVNLEKMISDTGGGSAPGEPVEFGQFRMLHQPLVRANNQNNAATAMHAVNHNFANPLVTNLRPENIFMGSARSNTQIHFCLVELPIRNSMKQATAGAAVAYQNALLAHQPTPCTQDPNLLLWDQAGMNLPGADVHNPPLVGAQSAPLVQATHSVDLDGLFNDVTWGGWPKVIQYTVIPQYTYPAWPNFPQFLIDNINETRQDIVDEQATAAPNNALIALVQAAVARLKVIGPDLFPEDFTCTAVYWYPSYDPAAPWYQSTDHDIFDAEV